MENKVEAAQTKEFSIPVKRNMSLLVSTVSLEAIADAIFTLCLAWFVLERTGSALVTSTITAIRYIVNIFAGPLIGVFVDRTQPKKAMVRSYIVLALIGMILIFFYIFLEDWIVFTIMAMVILNDVAQTFIRPSQRRILPDLVGEERIVIINGYMNSAAQGGALLGRAVGGILLSLIGLVGVMLTHSFIFLLAALFASWLVLPKQESSVAGMNGKTKGRFWDEFKDGAKLLVKHRALFHLTLINLGINFVTVGHLYMVLLKRQYGANAAQFGLLEATGMATAIVGGLVVGRLVKKMKPIYSLSIGLLVGGVSLALFGVFDQLMYAFILQIVDTFASLFYIVTFHTLLITLVKPEFRARIDTLVVSISSFAMPLSIFITGFLADIIAVRYMFYFTGLWGILMWFILILNKEVRKLEKV